MSKHGCVAVLFLASFAFIPTIAMAQWSSWEPDVDRPGMDYNSFDIRGGPRACRNSCLSDDRCRAWTFVRSGIQGPSPRCWLKDGRPAPQDNDCCVSGVIRR